MDSNASLPRNIQPARRATNVPPSEAEYDARVRAADRTVLEAFVEAFVEDAARSGYPELIRRQRPPYGTFGHGAAGVAYALARAGRRDLAERWIRPALAA